MKPQDYTKDKEIALIKNLVAMYGYFATLLEQFLGSDMETVEINIKNDFPLEFGSRLAELINKVKSESKAMQLACHDKLLSLVGHVDEKGEEIITSAVGRIEVMRYKRANGKALSATEIDFLLEVAGMTLSSK
jgi:hypothetical protein